MPDIDDLFEDIVDGVKKHLRKQKQRQKKVSKKDFAERRAPSLLERLMAMLLPSSAETTPQRDLPQVDLPQRDLSTSARPLAAPKIRSATLRRYMEQANAYESGLLELTTSASSEFNQTRLAELHGTIRHWQDSLSALVQRVDDFHHNELLQHDLEAVPQAVTRLERQLEDASNGRIRQELERTLANRRQQLSSLHSLNEMMEWAELKIENTVSMLGSLYSQALMSQSKGQVANYQRLLADVEEEARSLDDYVATIAEVKFGPAALH